MFDPARWQIRLPELKQAYQAAHPFPHIVLDDFLPALSAEEMTRAFPTDFSQSGWIHYRHFNENKHGLNDLKKMPHSIGQFIETMHAPAFISFLEKLTGISSLLPDKTLEGAGAHLCGKGGYLNIHADFAFHPKIKNLHRRLNVLLYLNKDWHPPFGGDLEFWSADMQRCEKKIAPLFNRLIVFNTTDISYHGFPDPVQCPDNVMRKSIALYYYTQTDASAVSSTNYRTRPGERWKSLPNWIDNKLLFAYTLLKRKAGISDAFVSSLLGIRDKLFRRR